MKLLDTQSVRLAILHHSVHEPRPASSAYAEMIRIKGWHHKRGFDDIGYHFVVNDNSYAAGRPLPYQGAHCRNWNHVSVGICVCGDLTKRRPTDAEVAATVAAIREAEAQIGHKLVVAGHKDLANTFCPGPDLVRLVNEQRTSP